MSGLIQDLLEINRRLSFELWHITTIKDKPRGLSPRMLLPSQVEDDIRIGEHEPMILYCGLLNGLSYYYLTENPSEMSASSDLNLFAFRDNSFVKVAGVEFKAHNPGTEIIRQDVRKLVKDKVTGNWFHILEDFDPDTIKDLFAKLTRALGTCADSLNDEQLSILFCFCILEKQWTCIKHFYYDRSRGDFDTYVENFFDLDCVVESNHIVVSKGLDWYIFQLYTEGFLGN